MKRQKKGEPRGMYERRARRRIQPSQPLQPLGKIANELSTLSASSSFQAWAEPGRTVAGTLGQPLGDVLRALVNLAAPDRALLPKLNWITLGERL